MSKSIRWGAACVAALACGSTEPREGRVVGAILPNLDHVPIIEVPDIIRAGEPFTAVINSFGSSSCTTPDGIDLKLRGSEATVTPYDLVPVDGETPCTADFAARPHPVELEFRSEGTARINARGRHVGGTVPGSSIVTVTRTVTVLSPYARLSSPPPRTSP